MVQEVNSESVDKLNEPVPRVNEPVNEDLTNQLPKEIKDSIKKMSKRNTSKEDTAGVIVALCKWRPLKLKEITYLLGRTSEKHILHTYITSLRREGKQHYTEPDIPNHPEQAYKASTA